MITCTSHNYKRGDVCQEMRRYLG